MAIEEKKVAIVCTTGVERIELLSPLERLRQEGAEVEIITPDGKPARTINHIEWAEEVKADKAITDAKAQDYDLLVLPGGVMNPDFLRLSEETINFIKEYGKLDRPIAAICHGSWTLINAGLVEGKEMTSWPSLSEDLRNAGANWVDEEVVIDGNLITSRKPDDLEAFNNAIVNTLSE